MKRILISLIAVCIVSLTASAQVRVAVGPKVGINFATISFDRGGTTFVSSGGRTGMLFGAIVDISFGNMFGVQVEPTYIMKGAGIVSPFGRIPGTRALNYFEFPLLFKARWMQGKFIPFSFMGPSIGFNVSATDSYGQGQDVDLSQATSGSDFSLLFGSGLEVKASSLLGIFLDMRFELGLSDTQSQTFLFGGQSSQKNRGFMIQVGALFYVG